MKLNKEMVERLIERGYIKDVKYNDNGLTLIFGNNDKLYVEAYMPDYGVIELGASLSFKVPEAPEDIYEYKDLLCDGEEG